MPLMTTLVSSFYSFTLQAGTQACAPLPLKPCQFLLGVDSSHCIFSVDCANFPQQTDSHVEYSGLAGSVQSQLQSSHRNFDIYEQVARGMDEKGHKGETQQSRAKIKEMRQVYQKAREAPKTCHFYKELHVILCGDTTSTHKSSVDTSGGLEATASRVNPEAEVLDEEVELEEDVGQATGLFGAMASQDLFLISERSSQSQQSRSGVPEAERGALETVAPIRSYFWWNQSSTQMCP
ncbi:uncharacterized protein LOC142047079 [Chelonoidis abingdonii]|uniref:uncharacterized protein LOC142047079 n=1 Tax=Chelonoidis abingdonii TaxID=106734 RepID=UPI003F496C00